jgi:GntR family transcriptional repressor for pyruvate dehydrogenase complex
MNGGSGRARLTSVPRPPEAENRIRALFSPRDGRGSASIVEQLVDLVRAQHLRPGDQLPPERELGQLLGASRATVREALRVLESRGLLRVRVGARGGAFVAIPSSNHAGQGFLDLLISRGVSISQVTEARRVLEIGVIPIVCTTATEADLARLAALNERDQQALQEGTYQESHGVEFHQAFVASAHNPVVDTMMASIRDVLLASLRLTQRVPATSRTEGLAEHRDLIDAVAGGRVADAVRIVRRHLERTEQRASAVGC